MVVTVGRSDYGIYRSLLGAIEADPDLELQIIASGMHLSPEFGSTAAMIERDGFKISEKVEMLLSSDSSEGTAKSIGLGVIGFSQLFARSRPETLVVLGDRFEMFSAVLAALPFQIPVAHVHGGEITSGAIDDALRHSMTKLSHLHFVSTPEYERRVLQLGEEPWRITLSGAPALDRLDTIKLMTREELEKTYRLRLDRRPLLVTFHPTTLEDQQVASQVSELLAALDTCGLPLVFTAPNADAHGREVRAMIEAFVVSHSHAQFVDNFGQDGYYSIMSASSAMVGNSSSGIIEAASFHLPVVNIGLRQAGRVRGGNVIDVDGRREDILDGIRRATSETFRTLTNAMPNPYRAGSRSAASIIAERLKAVPLDQTLLIKRFHDVEVSR